MTIVCSDPWAAPVKLQARLESCEHLPFLLCLTFVVWMSHDPVLADEFNHKVPTHRHLVEHTLHIHNPAAMVMRNDRRELQAASQLSNEYYRPLTSYVSNSFM